jgi:threonine synthase
VPPRCPAARAGDDIDHVLTRHLDPSVGFPRDADPNPFIRFRTLSHAYHAALGDGMTDAHVRGRIRALDDAVRETDGRGFEVTALTSEADLARELGLSGGADLLVKDETCNVAGSHKGRGLFGTMLELELAGAADAAAPLAIASCGNAALAAAVVAHAAGRQLRVFIPPEADPLIVGRLGELGAQVEACERAPGELGDPTYRRLQVAIDDGAVPFTCQGNLNAFAIEGGMTLGWELAGQLAERTARGRPPIDHLVIQVGGGALASSVMQALDEARQLGVLSALPRIHTVQTCAAAPLARAYQLITSDLQPAFEAGAADAREIEVVVHAASRQRSAYMWPWESPPTSVATGILDDETYDWVAVVRGMLRSGGIPVAVDEATLARANTLARRTGIDVDHTGSAGLAGAIELLRIDEITPNQSIAVIFTGVRRQSPANGVHP